VIRFWQNQSFALLKTFDLLQPGAQPGLC